MIRPIAALAAVAMIGCGTTEPQKKDAPAPDPVKITQFYPSQSVAARGEEVLICYGVENAASVRLDPAIEEITPSMNRCIQFAPKSTAEYKLIATGKDGSQAVEQFAIKVEGVAKPKSSASGGAAGGLIQTFLSSAGQVGAGQPVTLCYQTSGAKAVKIDPGVAALPSPEKGCVTAKPQQTTTYTLTATGTSGESDKMTVTVKVQ
ncbi:MAG: hypothetical protein ACRD7E_30110 [Bryobacteraceae bacterium]